MSRALGLFALGAVLTACPKDPGEVAPVWEATPRLPAPSAGVYARSRETPSDPALAAFVAEKPWDAALSGAAAGLALKLVGEIGGPEESPGLTRWRVREAMWKAGYPFPALDARAWQAGPDGAPPPPLVAWLDAFPAGDDLGLVRARGRDQDLWVALRSRPTVDVGRIPRQVPEGGTFTIPANPGGRYRVSDANGFLLEGTLDAPAEIEANSTGEWVVEILPAEAGPPALFPVYVGMVPPDLPLIREPAAVRSPADVVERAETLLADIREIYGASQLQRDFVLDAGARSLLRGDTDSAEGVRESLALDSAGTTIFRCEGTTVEACLDRVVWQPENRRALFDDASALGLAGDLDAEGATVVGIVSVTH
jgi:hypothetical protein